jgi:hypothetical protein
MAVGETPVRERHAGFRQVVVLDIADQVLKEPLALLVAVERLVDPDRVVDCPVDAGVRSRC